MLFLATLSWLHRGLLLLVVCTLQLTRPPGLVSAVHFYFFTNFFLPLEYTYRGKKIIISVTDEL